MSEHRHYWTRPDDAESGDRWACDECVEISESCFRCDRWTGTSLLICDRCVRAVRRVIDHIETALALVQPQPRSPIPAIRYDRDRIRGTLSEDHNPLRWTLADVHQVLIGWADHWAEESGMARAISAPDYLRGHVLWAAHNREASDWGQWLTEMHHALAVAKREAGILPKRMSSPCVHCGGVAVQDWADKDLRPYDDGLQDEVRCLGCRLTWSSAAHFGQVSKEHLQQLPERQPDTLVTLGEAALVWPDVPTRTWQTWINRGEIPDPVAWDVRGVPQYLVGDLAVLPERRADRTRRGRRAG